MIFVLYFLYSVECVIVRNDRTYYYCCSRCRRHHNRNGHYNIIWVGNIAFFSCDYRVGGGRSVDMCPAWWRHAAVFLTWPLEDMII